MIKNGFAYYAHLIKYSNYFGFSLLELKSLLNITKTDFTIDENYSYDIRKEALVKFYTDSELTKDKLDIIFRRTVLIKNIFHSYGVNSNIEELVKNLNKEEIDREAACLDTFRFDVEGLDISLDREYQTELINKFTSLNFQAKVSLKNAKRVFVIYYNKSDGLFHFGKIIGRSDDKIYYYNKYSLQERKYLGPTSTDNRLSFLMANFAQVQPGDLVLDPFVGTGSLLIPASHFG